MINPAGNGDSGPRLPLLVLLAFHGLSWPLWLSWASLGLSGPFRASPGLLGYLRACLGFPQLISWSFLASLSFCGILWTSLGFSGLLWVFLAFSGFLWFSIGFSGPLWAFLCFPQPLSWPLRVSPDFSELSPLLPPLLLPLAYNKVPIGAWLPLRMCVDGHQCACVSVREHCTQQSITGVRCERKKRSSTIPCPD